MSEPSLADVFEAMCNRSICSRPDIPGFQSVGVSFSLNFRDRILAALRGNERAQALHVPGFRQQIGRPPREDMCHECGQMMPCRTLIALANEAGGRERQG